MASLQPRAVLVTRQTDYERLLAMHATRGQAAFFLQSRGQTLDAVFAQHDAFTAAVHAVRTAIPDTWRVAHVNRADLDRFLFSPEDIILAVGQDGLVANVAKYLSGQPVLGINPAPQINEGVLVPLCCDQVARLARAAAENTVDIERRTMVRATLDDGQTLQALNEIFVGHRSHQSARYVITLGDKSERQSSSGVIVTTGTGATGWARSIMTSNRHTVKLAPTDPALAFFVREPWPSVATGTSIAWGPLTSDRGLTILSNMNDGGVIFADGVEQDHLSFGWGRVAALAVAPTTLNLVRDG
jgi:NAD kinase